jgi:hypothetical protein
MGIGLDARHVSFILRMVGPISTWGTLWVVSGGIRREGKRAGPMMSTHLVLSLVVKTVSIVLFWPRTAEDSSLRLWKMLQPQDVSNVNASWQQVKRLPRSMMIVVLAKGNQKGRTTLMIPLALIVPTVGRTVSGALFWMIPAIGSSRYR